MMKFVRLTLLAALALPLSGCLYRMPEDDEVSLVPNTNNPTVYRENSSKWQPSISH